MEGGITILLFLLILGGLGIGGFLLFGAGGYARHRQKQVELDERDEIVDDSDETGDGDRPTHLRVADEGASTFDVPSPTGAGQKPPLPPE